MEKKYISKWFINKKIGMRVNALITRISEESGRLAYCTFSIGGNLVLTSWVPKSQILDEPEEDVTYHIYVDCLFDKRLAKISIRESNENLVRKLKDGSKSFLRIQALREATKIVGRRQYDSVVVYANKNVINYIHNNKKNKLVADVMEDLSHVGKWQLELLRSYKVKNNGRHIKNNKGRTTKLDKNASKGRS